MPSLLIYSGCAADMRRGRAGLRRRD